MSVGQELGASSRDILIGLMTAWQESQLRNLTYGDRDSVGLFQQRDAWAPLSTRMNPREAAKMFFLGGQQGQRGLFAFKNRDSMSLTQAAQKVQVSAFPNAYAKWESRSREMLKALGADPGVGMETPAQTGDPQQALPGLLGTPVQVHTDALGVDAAAPPGVDDGPAGLGAMSAMGIESADEQPDMGDGGGMGMEFLPASGEGGFDEHFPKSGVVGGQRQRVADFAKTLLGTPYVWGGTSPDGLDCSGFTQLVYKQLGINLPRVSAAQARYGKRVDIGGLQVGDMVAWDNSSRNNGADHIAIYLGDGQIIEAPRPGLGVRIRSLGKNEGAWGVSLNY
jgi:hypothetical protein